MSEYVYLIWAKETNRYKIGVSSSPKSRLVSLQTASPYPLELIATKKIGNALFEERRLHSKYAEFKKHREWFEFTDAVVIAVICDCSCPSYSAAMLFAHGANLATSRIFTELDKNADETIQSIIDSYERGKHEAAQAFHKGFMGND